MTRRIVHSVSFAFCFLLNVCNAQRSCFVLSIVPFRTYLVMGRLTQYTHYSVTTELRQWCLLLSTRTTFHENCLNCVIYKQHRRRVTHIYGSLVIPHIISHKNENLGMRLYWPAECCHRHRYNSFRMSLAWKLLRKNLFRLLVFG